MQYNDIGKGYLGFTIIVSLVKLLSNSVNQTKIMIHTKNILLEKKKEISQAVSPCLEIMH
jgi:hypothetical protein